MDAFEIFTVVMQLACTALGLISCWVIYRTIYRYGTFNHDATTTAWPLIIIQWFLFAVCVAMTGIMAWNLLARL